MKGILMEKYALNETNVTRELKENYSRDKPVTSGAKKPTKQPMDQLSLNSPQGPWCPLRHEPNEGRKEGEGARQQGKPPTTTTNLTHNILLSVNWPEKLRCAGMEEGHEIEEHE
ncbi:hypothetical protein Pmani_013441 [Petrolisthes manimaculis]|uniref:Uncharacterized protein n=1 Tax=Petrolisthes manimaculis TaxID=1843537 RepID=A0AAE1UDN4_9EUCA|nr:hypothetical protein Pmani_013441 [Petrolisthes manimaculis]